MTRGEEDLSTNSSGCRCSSRALTMALGRPVIGVEGAGSTLAGETPGKVD